MRSLQLSLGVSVQWVSCSDPSMQRDGAVEWYAVLSFCVVACNPCSVKRCSGEIIPGKKGIDGGSHVVWSGGSNVAVMWSGVGIPMWGCLLSQQHLLEQCSFLEASFHVVRRCRF